MDLCGKSRGFADFENTEDRGSAVIFEADCACLKLGPWVLNEIWITNLSSALIVMLMSSSKLFLFSVTSDVRANKQEKQHRRRTVPCPSFAIRNLFVSVYKTRPTVNTIEIFTQI